MIIGLLIGKANSMECPGKNTREVFGRPLAEYGFMALHHSDHVDRIFVSTDSPEIAAIGAPYAAHVIDRPKELAQPTSTVEDTLKHAYAEIEAEAGPDIEALVLVFANSPHIPPGHIDKGIEKLRENPDADSVTSLCKMNMFSPARARKILDDGSIGSFVDLSLIPNVSSIRDEQGDCYFEDFAVQVLRKRCLTDIDNGHLPFKWMGKKSLPMFHDFGLDIDHEWQFPVIEYWLQAHGFGDDKSPYEE